MRNYSVQKLLRSAAVGALAIMALTSAQAIAGTTIKPDPNAPGKDDGIVITDAAKKVKASNVSKFVAQLPADERKVVKALTKIEQAQVYLNTEINLSANLDSDELRVMTPAQQLVKTNSVRAGLAFYFADAKYNYCNVMLASEAKYIYDENGLKKLMKAPINCPSNVSIAKSLEYVNHVLACAVGDPAYTRVMPGEETADFRKEVDGTKVAFAGGGSGMMLSADPSKRIPLSDLELMQWNEGKAKYLAHPPLFGDKDDCTGKRTPLTAKQKAANAKFWSTSPESHKMYFNGVIWHVMKGSPAETAGIVDGDRIVKVDGVPVGNLEFGWVVENLLRGPIDTTFKLTLERDPTKEFTITRKPILADNVWSRDMGDGVYSIIVTQFERSNTGFEILDKMQKIGDKAKEFIFDVRSNPGGIVDAGVESVTWLIHDGVIFSQRTRVAGDPSHPKWQKTTYKRVGSKIVVETVDDKTHKLLERKEIALSERDPATGNVLREFKDQPFLGNKPMVVLVNGQCASACEIFSGGVGENHIAASSADNKAVPQGAEVIGVQTYGKGIGQQVAPGPRGTSIKATLFRYFSPRGKWYGDAWKTKIGLTPDIKVVQPENAVPYTDSDVQLQFAKQYLLSGGKATPPAAPAASTRPGISKP